MATTLTIGQITPNAATTQWTFEAFLQVKDQTSTIASIANSIVPGKGDTLPYFVGSIVVAAKGDPLHAPIKLIYTGMDTEGSIMAVWVNISPFNITFIQYRPPVTTSSSTPTVKRILRISCVVIKFPCWTRYLWLTNYLNPSTTSSICGLMMLKQIQI